MTVSVRWSYVATKALASLIVIIEKLLLYFKKVNGYSTRTSPVHYITFVHF